MARLRWTGGTFVDSSRGFNTTGGEHEFDDKDRVEEYLGHRSGNWERVEGPTDATADEEAVPETIDEEQADDDAGDDEADAEDVQEASDEELREVLDGTNDEVAEALATGEYDDHLDRLAELEAAGEDRKGAIEAIKERRED